MKGPPPTVDSFSTEKKKSSIVSHSSEASGNVLGARQPFLTSPKQIFLLP